MIINSIPCAQQTLEHDYTKSLCKVDVESSVKMGSIDSLRKNKLKISHWGRVLCGLSHMDSTKVTMLLTTFAETTLCI